LASILPALAITAAASAQQDPSVAPPNPEGVGITEHLGEHVPLELTFTDEQGRAVKLGEYFDGERPVMLNLVYYRCPSLCNAFLTGLTYTLKDLDWSAGDQFEIVTVSIDPAEDSQLAAGKKRSYLVEYDRAGAEGGWHFLVGEPDAIETLAERVGFEYRYEERTGLFTHAASLMIVTPDGRLSRYFNDVMFEPEALRRAVDDAAQGVVGTPFGHTLLRWCYVYDPSAGKYVVRARRIMTISGALVVVVTFAGLSFFWHREIKRQRIDNEALA
jgi:protein SCO1/2